MKQHEVRYCNADDGTRLAFAVSGTGPPLVICPLFVESFSLEHMVPELQDFNRRVGEGRTVLRYDMRGTGLSEGTAESISIERLAKDLQAVTDAAGLRDFDLFATSLAGPVALVFAATHEKRLRRLVIYGSFKSQSDAGPAANGRNLSAMLRDNWEMGAWMIGEMGGPRPEHPAFQPSADDDGAGGVGALYRRSTKGAIAAAFVDACIGIDVGPQLSQIRAPTLVIHKRGDPIYPFRAGQRLAAAIPGARFVTLDGNTNLPAGRGDERLVAPIREFLSAEWDEQVSDTHAAPAAELTPREREVLRLLAKGSSNREVAASLVLSERTVARHITNIYAKIEARGRADATAYALKHGIA